MEIVERGNVMGGKKQDILDEGKYPVPNPGIYDQQESDFVKMAKAQQEQYNRNLQDKIAPKKPDQVRQSSTVSQTDQPDSNFGTSMLVAETTGSMSLGYAAGGDIGGAMLGAELHSSMDTSCSVSDNSSSGSCDTSSSSGGGDFGGGGASDSF